MATDTHLYKQIKNSIYIYIGEIKIFFSILQALQLKLRICFPGILRTVRKDVQGKKSKLQSVIIQKQQK